MSKITDLFKRKQKVVSSLRRPNESKEVAEYRQLIRGVVRRKR